MINKNVNYLKKPIFYESGGKTTIAWLIYFIVYSGYLKVLFPKVSVFFVAIQMASILVGFVYIIFTKRTVIYHKVITIPIVYTVIFFAMMSFVALWTNNYSNALNKIESMAVTLIFMLILYALGTLMETAREYDYLFSVIVIVNIIFLLLYITIHISNIRQMIYAGLRGGDIDSNPIWIARIASDTTLVILISKNKWKKSINTFLILFLAFLMLFMGSRGALVALFLSLFFYYKNEGKKKSRKILPMAITAIIISCIIFIIFVFFSNTYILQRFSLNSIFISAPGYRVSRYLFTLQKIPEKLLYGHGLGSWAKDYWEQVPYYPIWETAQMRAIDYPHNIFLEILYDGGLLCLIPFVFIIKKILKIKSRVINWRYGALYYLFVANILYSLFSGSVTEGNRGIYYILAFLCGIMAKDKSLKDT